MTPINMNIVSMGTLNASLVHPLTIAYWVNRVHASGINYFGNTIKYELVPDGKDDLPPDAKPAVGVHCATYAKYDLMPEDEFIRYEFDGWYYDKGLKKKVPGTIMVAEDHTFYGTYHKVAGLITTEVVNGTITDGNECVPYGTDYNIDYAPKDGYLLDTVTVDGKPADDPKTDDGTPSDDPKTEDTTPKDDDKTPADDTKKQDDQKPVITPTETDDKKDTTTPTQDSSKSDDDTKKTTVKDNTGSSDDSGKGQSTPGSDGKGQSTQTTAPKTGDESNVTLWVILMLAAACAAGGLGIFAATKGRRRR